MPSAPFFQKEPTLTCRWSLLMTFEEQQFSATSTEKPCSWGSLLLDTSHEVSDVVGCCVTLGCGIA